MSAELAGGQVVIEILYLIASVLFILSLKWMSSPTTARHGIWAGEAGMVLAICGTLLHHGIVDYRLIAIALVLGTIIGIPLGRVLSAHARYLALHDVGLVPRSHPGRFDLYRQLDGRRQAAGNSAAAAA